MEWYCLIINSTSHYGKSNIVVEEIEGIFSKSKEKPQFIVIEDKEIKKTGEYMIFVCSPDFQSKKEQIVRLSSVVRIIENDGISYRFSDSEVKKFTKSIEKNGADMRFKKGDVVFVRDGYLKNLYGLVTGKNRDGSKIKVLFKFHVRSFIRELNPKDLRLEKNIFKDMPCNISNQDWFKRFV